jgi:hypothetical protein
MIPSLALDQDVALLGLSSGSAIAVHAANAPDPNCVNDAISH